MDLIDVADAGIETVIESNPIGLFITKIAKNEENSIQEAYYENRYQHLNNRVKSIDNYIKKIEYLLSDESKCILIRNWLFNFLYKIDPALVETNIKMIVDFISNKYVNSEYEVLLNNIVFLNKYSIKVLKTISECENERGYYSWESLLDKYEMKKKTQYYEIINKTDKTNKEIEIAYGIQSLVENKFISTSYTNLAGSINENIISFIQITGIGQLLLNYI